MPSGQPWFDDEPRDGEPRAVEPLFDPAEHLALLVRRFLGQLERFRARADAPDASEDAAGRRFALDRRLAAFDAELHARLAISDPALLPIEQLQRRFGLRDQTIELLIGAAASALDLTAARAIVELTGSAQCDVGFLCNVIADDPLAQRLLLGDLGEVAPLVRYRLVRLGAARGWLPEGPLMMAPIMVPDRVVRWLRGETHFEGQRFERSARLLRGADGATFEDATASLLDRVLFRTADGGARLPTVVAGPSLSGKTTAVVFAADVRRATVLELDLHPLMFAADPLETIQDVVREACLHDAVLLVRHAELLLEDRRANLRHAIAGAMADGRLWVVLTTRGEVGDFLRMAPGTQLLRLDMPTETEQLRLWHRALPPAIPRAADLHPERLVRRYHLTPGDIGEAAGTAVVAAMRQGSPVTLQHMTEAVRGRLRHRLKDIADVVETTVEWDDIVLREDIVDRIIELLSVVQYEKVVMDQWGFSQRFSYGRGLSALFSGPPGTGKTMIAGLIAKELGLELFRVDLSRIVSKWVGETEKNLDAAFAEAEESSAVLFFDEAEALFGKRGEVRHGTDRYANLEVSFLLQRLERHDGLVILASNLRDEIDPAFVRRFQHVVHFPRPSERERRRLWRLAFPAEAPLAPDVDLGVFARLDLTGAGIVGSARVAALAAARAASESIRIEHIVEAVTGQYQREARALTTTDLGPYASVLRTLNGDATERRAAR
jgi:AAA+ superfamily predicted ATPase